MERNILLGIVVLLVFIIVYKLYRINKISENYGEVIESEFIISKKENDKTIYEKYLEYIVYLVPSNKTDAKTSDKVESYSSNNKNSIIANIHKIYEYLSPSISFAPGLDASSSSSSSPSSSTVGFPIDKNAGYIFLIFFGLLVLIFIIVKYKAIIGLFSSKKSSSDSRLLSSDGSSESSNSSE